MIYISTLKSISVGLLIVFLSSCNSSKEYHIKGNTMGTTYSIKYQGNADLKKDIDSLLVVVNNSMSTYIKSSTISKVNNANVDCKILIDPFFAEVYMEGLKIAENTGGAFDYTVMPIVSYYGFGPKSDTTKLLEDWKSFIGYNKVSIEIEGDSMVISKDDPRVKLDFSAIAKGYGVDKCAELLKSNSVENAMVEIGGEVYSFGKNNKGKYWRIGIEKVDGSTGFSKIQQLKNEGIATSGNYRNIREVNGIKYAHTIDPKIGKPALSNVLSATVVAQSCMQADAYATALMVMGSAKAIAFSKKNNLNVYLIYSDSTNNQKVFSSLKD